ncbi:MAG: hypothetical protein REI64_17130 [Pedobacter sp.]|uniref:hypothetical protein n=1 Tax=Pedobacter sp. TaxID=1411316 RepID=UPI002807E8A5|nr:hypothetical protein [Pedobacter sp.]MDQ8006529.1 hypothetical protein [Pedobacter sp.]
MKNKLSCFVLLIALFGLGCKKGLSDDITQYNWVLESQMVTPAITLYGKTSTDYLALQNPEGCTKNNTLNFKKDGTYSISSNGSLCDMATNSSNQKWTRTDNELVLNYDAHLSEKFFIEKDKMTKTESIEIEGKNYVFITVRKAKK